MNRKHLLHHKTFVAIFIVAFSFVSSFAQQRDNTWQLVWQDEFDGSGTFDETKWVSEIGFVRNKEIQYYQPQNAYRQNGLLILEAIPDSITNPRYEEGSNDWRKSRKTARYSSGSIKTRDKYSFLYGQLEVRARIPVVNGAWPAIWMLGTQYPWPSNGEVDIMEFYQANKRPHLHANAAWGNNTPNVGTWNSKKIDIQHFLDQDPDWGEKFHIWLMDWTPDYMRIYVDGELLNDIDITNTINGNIGNNTNPFHLPHYILLNLALDIRVNPNPNIFPMRYEVDYVRVWQKKQ